MNLNAHNETQLERFLDEKGLEYAPFDPARAPKILQQLNIVSLPTQTIIQVIGTNGKGSTGRFLSLILHKIGFNVGHFSSPHLLSLEERFWKNGANLSREVLNEAFLALDSTAELQLEKASYFEVLTFLALEVFKNCDILVLEAGLGGEFDSTTTCVQAELSLFTSIGLDHQEFLGDTLEKIATTKLKAMSKRAILGFQSENAEEIISIAQEIAKEKNAKLEILKEIPDEISQWIARKDQHLNKDWVQAFANALANPMKAESLSTLAKNLLKHFVKILAFVLRFLSKPISHNKPKSNFVLDNRGNLSLQSIEKSHQEFL